MKKKSTSPSLAQQEALSKQLRSFLSKEGYEPLTQSALFKHLKIPTSLLSAAKKIITDLLQEDYIEIEKNKILYKKKKPATVKGTFRMHPRGFGFVIPESPLDLDEDVFIAKHLTDSAVDGDLVEVALFSKTKKDKGPEGKILSVLKRGRSHLAGTVRIVESSGFTMIHVPLLGPNKPVHVISKYEGTLQHGDRVIVKIVDWGGQNKPILCEISHIIGHISDPSIDIKAAIEEFNLKSTFPAEAIKQAKSYGKQVSTKHLKNRLNLTKTECFTIDPSTAKDFDDALSIHKDPKGNYHVGVHIADVAHYVPHGSPLDVEAFLRGNSTYFPGACIPMLPEELSNNLCSLKPGVTRLCVSVLMTFDCQGDLLHYDIERTYIKSAKRFTYEEAKEVLDGKKKSAHVHSLKLMVELCLLLKKKRSERGSIDFALPEFVIQVDEKGNPFDFKFVEYDITHQLVEEYMLKANELVAKFLSEKVKSLLFRIHEEPNEENIEDFYTLARSLGFSLPPTPTHQDLQKLFEQAKQTRFGQQLAVAFIRSMKLAYYSPENVGHYGLALEYYCHFTSPIRRYPDLVIQRLLFNEQPEESDLEEIAESCSEKERISFKAEQSVKTLKKLRLLKKYQTEDPTQIYSCIITKVKPFGIFFEISPLTIEGFIHVSDLEEDYFIYEPVRNSLFGQRTHIRHCIGDQIQTRLRSIDFVVLEAKWSMVSNRKKPYHFQKSKKKSEKKRRK
jgi:ribonuclease R